MENESYTPFDTFNFALSCKAKGQNQLARVLFEDVLNETANGLLKARCYLGLGQLAELRRKYEVALDFYEKGLALQSTEQLTAYFLVNNSAFCFNLLGRHDEAEALCRKAILIDPTKHNGWKNLGMSLEAQGDLIGAARGYVEATKIAPGDVRAFVLLQRLLETHPDLQTDFPGVLLDKAACIAAIKAATERVRVTEICQLKYIPWGRYFEKKAGVERPISIDELMDAYGVTPLAPLDDFPNMWVSIVSEDDAGSVQPTTSSSVSSNFAPYIILRRD